MNRTLLLIAAAVVGALLTLAGARLFFEHRFSTLLTHAPSHGTRFLLEVESASAGDSDEEWARLREAIRQRAARVGVRIYWEPVSASRVSVVAANPNASNAATLQSSLFSQGV